MSEADIDDQVLGSSAMHNDAGELRTDEHEREWRNCNPNKVEKVGKMRESSCSVDPFLAIMGKEHNGRVRLHGRGVTPSNLGKASIGNGSSSINVPDELLESIKVDVAAQ
ncbi:hypothetical protein Dimus_008564 [Dionaea muscipula]